MRECRSSGSVEGVVSNHDPYSDSDFRIASQLRIYKRMYLTSYSLIGGSAVLKVGSFLPPDCAPVNSSFKKPTGRNSWIYCRESKPLLLNPMESPPFWRYPKARR